METELEQYNATWQQLDLNDYDKEWETALEGIVQSLTPNRSDDARRARVIDDINGALARMGLHVEPFGSTLCGMAFPDSDIDLLLVDPAEEEPLSELPDQQRKRLLRNVGNALRDAGVARRDVKFVLHARVPLVKVVHARTGIECDITIQSHDGALKGRYLAAAARLDARFPALVRLVKLWARAHECNDASQSTLNSTSLVYLAAFYLQRLGALPPLRVLSPRQVMLEVAGSETVRPLDPDISWLWYDEGTLNDLVGGVEARVDQLLRAKAAAHGGGGGGGDRRYAARALAASGHGLAKLLAGFLCFWEGPFRAWAAGRHRDVRPDCWNGEWKRRSYAKKYVVPLEDPFNEDDNPARSVGTATMSPGNQHRYIAAVLASNAGALRRLLLVGRARHSHKHVLQALAWTFGARGLRLLRPPLPARQLSALVEAADEDALESGGSAHRWLVLRLGGEPADSDVFDHTCWRELGLREQEEEQRRRQEQRQQQQRQLEQQRQQQQQLEQQRQQQQQQQQRQQQPQQQTLPTLSAVERIVRETMAQLTTDLAGMSVGGAHQQQQQRGQRGGRQPQAHAQPPPPPPRPAPQQQQPAPAPAPAPARTKLRARRRNRQPQPQQQQQYDDYSDY